MSDPEAPAAAARWATFDCYGTLIDWEAGIAQTLARIWPDRDAGGLVARFHEVEPKVQEGSSAPYREVLADALRGMAAEEGLALPAGEEHALSESLPTWPVFEEVPEALGELRRRGWRLAILSNTDPDLLAASCDSMGVAPDLTITAAEAGSYKPAHGHWDRFFELSGAERDRHVHVGASLFHDIAPAGGELGLKTVWVNRKAEITNLPRDAELMDLMDLPATVERLVPAQDDG